MEESQANKFQHERLYDDRNQIRLVQILPDLTSDGLIQLSMRLYPLQPCGTSSGSNGQTTIPSYSCLSYTWGDGANHYMIHINGQSFGIHHNLWKFLVTLRQHLIDYRGLRYHQSSFGPRSTQLFVNSPDCYFWIDAICIDQSNNLEKGHQVQKMGEIYKKAILVMIWLTPGNCDGSVLHRMQYVKSADISAMRHIRHSKLIHRMLTSNYWTRAWVTQEIVLARKAAFFMKSGLYDFGDVGREFRRLNVLESRSEFRQMLIAYENWPSATLARRNTLSVLRELGHEKQCLNVLDRVYSTLALPIHTSSIEVDYSISSTQLARNALIACRDSFCICSYTMLTRTLQLPSHAPHALDDMYMTIRDGGYSYSHRLECEFCHGPVKDVWKDEKYNMLCLQRFCSISKVHVFARFSSYPFYPVYSNEVFYEHNGALTRLSGSHLLRPFSTGSWRISFQDLVIISRLVLAESRRVKFFQRAKKPSLATGRLWSPVKLEERRLFRATSGADDECLGSPKANS